MDDELSGVSQRDFEAMLRRYLARLGARYGPVLAVFAGLALIVLLVPTTQPSASTGALGGTTGGVTQGAAPGTAGAAAGSASAGTTPAGGTAATSGTGGATTGPVASAGGTGTGAATVTPPETSGGVARTGVRCGQGARQVTWSAYAPLCVAAWHGFNGGATAPGVTASTITLTFRLANSAQQSAINALASSANINQTDMVADLQSYIQFFNAQFELYGRHVVLKTFQGQGDYIQEDQGQDLSATQADAVTAHDLGAFGDVTFDLEASEPYTEDLASEHVISFSAVGMPQSWFERYAPYEYSVQGQSGTSGAIGAAAVICRRAAGLPAIFAGDPVYQHETRSFGLIYPENPQYAEVAQEAQRTLAQCGVHLALAPVAYSINVANYEQEAIEIAALMKSKNVTTVLCSCDPIFPILLTNAFQQQNYHPEISTPSFGDPVSRDYNQTQWAHTIAGGAPGQFPPLQQTESFKTFQLGYPGRHPAEWAPNSPPYFYVAYYTLLQVYDALQAAGPVVTPASFERAMFSLPPSDPGDPVAGRWVFGQNVFNPVASFGLTWWDPNAVSNFDGGKGAYRWCNGGQIYLMSNLAALGGPRQQLSCFGR